MHSRPGHGSRFTIGAARAAAVAEIVPIASEPARIGAPLASATVVCIDNEPDVLAGMEFMLAGWGCRVIAARDASDAIAALDAAAAGAGEPQIPTIIVADYHLDHGTGVDAILAIRARVNADTPGVIVTADHSPEVQRELRAMELTLLRKPLRAAALRAVLMQSMRRMAAE